jgi:hypothetical protein
MAGVQAFAMSGLKNRKAETFLLFAFIFLQSGGICSAMNIL